MAKPIIEISLRKNLHLNLKNIYKKYIICREFKALFLDHFLMPSQVFLIIHQNVIIHFSQKFYWNSSSLRRYELLWRYEIKIWKSVQTADLFTGKMKIITNECETYSVLGKLSSLHKLCRNHACNVHANSVSHTWNFVHSIDSSVKIIRMCPICPRDHYALTHSLHNQFWT